MQSPPFPHYLVPPRSKYSPQHHILKHPQLPFLPQCQRPSFRITKYQVSHKYTYSSWWWTWRGLKHVEVINKIDKTYWEYFAPSWFHWQDYIEMHGQQIIKFTCWCQLSGAILIQYVIYRWHRRLDMAAEIGACVAESNRHCIPKKRLLLTWSITLQSNMNKKHTTEFYLVFSFLTVLTKESCMSQLYVWMVRDIPRSPTTCRFIMHEESTCI